jgi:hypothetical protein
MKLGKIGRGGYSIRDKGGAGGGGKREGRFFVAQSFVLRRTKAFHKNIPRLKTHSTPLSSRD